MSQQQHINTYEEALATLKRALAFGINPSLEGIRLLMEELGHPENSYVPIQITGTNGKTSTTRLIEALLRSSGFKSGFYTSPELIDYTERIQIEGADISREEFARGMQRVSDARDSLTQKGLYEGDQITEFELLTALALFIFAQRHLDFAVLEVGLGGRWDATSVVAPSVAVITGIGLDHTNILGSSVQEIAADKAMIIKPGSTPVLGAHLGDALEVTGEIVDARDVQLHAAQGDQHARAHRCAAVTRAQAAVHGHRLGAVLAQVQRAQPARAAQRIVRVPVAGAAQAHATRVPVVDTVPQAHRTLVRDHREDGGAVDATHAAGSGSARAASIAAR